MTHPLLDRIVIAELSRAAGEGFGDALLGLPDGLLLARAVEHAGYEHFRAELEKTIGGAALSAIVGSFQGAGFDADIFLAAVYYRLAHAAEDDAKLRAASPAGDGKVN